LQGGQHTLPTLPQGVFPVFSGDRIIDPKRHMDKFLIVFDIHLIEHDDVTVRVFLHDLIGPSYEWYLSLLTHYIRSLDDLENMFMTMYAPPIAYQTLLTQFTQIHLKRGEIIRYSNMQFFMTLNQILEEQRQNALVIFVFYNNLILANVNYSMRSSQLNNLYGAIQKEMEMEEFMMETNVDPEIILGKIHIQMNTLAIHIKDHLLREMLKIKEWVEGSSKGFPLMLGMIQWLLKK
jgi:hypothetical protein